MNKKRLVKTFLELVNIDSPSGFEEDVICYLFDLLKDLDNSVSKDKYGNVIFKLAGEANPVLLCAHVDTVEPGRGIKPIVENEIIRSSGNTILGADNKAAVAVIIEVLRVLIASKAIHRDLEVVFTKSEEQGNLGAINLDYKNISAQEGYIFDRASSVGTITTASPFYNSFDIKLNGKTAHAAKFNKAINVLMIFNDALNGTKMGKVSNKTIINIGIVGAGYARNTIPGEMIIKGEVRSYSEMEIEYYSNLISKKFKESANKFGGTCEILVVRENSGYKYYKNDLFIVKTSKIMRKVGIRPVYKSSWGCSDANIFSEHKIKVLDLGDGSRYAHTEKECISVDNLTKLYKLIFSLITYTAKN